METRNRFYKAVDELQAKIRETQDENINKAAHIIADAVKGKHAVFVFDTGHIIDGELIGRVGGFAFLHKFKYSITTEGEHFTREEPKYKITGLAKYALQQAGVMEGDVMIIGSVSGKTENVIDLAIECQKMGVKVVAVTSVYYSQNLEPMHESGKRLYECCDVCIDNNAPWGDAMLKVEGLDVNFLPASGLSAAYIMWSVCADTLDILLENGIMPGVFESVNAPGTIPRNDAKRDAYKERGY